MRFDLFSSGRLYAALEKAGYPDLPAPRTLREWIKNDSAPEGARRAVAEILGIQEKAPSVEGAETPLWARNLADEIISAVRADRKATRASETREIAQAVAEALQGLLTQPPAAKAPAPDDP